MRRDNSSNLGREDAVLSGERGLTILCCPPHTSWPSLYSRAGWHLCHGCGRATNNMSQFRWRHLRRRRVLLRRPAGFVIAVDNPMRRFHRPRPFGPRVNSATRLQLTVPCSSLSLTRFAFRILDIVALFVDASGDYVGFPPHGRPRVGHSGDRRFGCGCGPHPTVIPSAS